jgi:DNA-binding transcriptional LysR family regulator
MTARQIEAFRFIILDGSLTAAALSLGVSQPAISRMIKDLTEDVGFTLFDRYKGMLKPTQKALMLFQEVERSFIALNQIQQEAAHIAQMTSGRLKVAAMPSLGSSLIPNIVDQFLANNPKVSLTVEVHSSPMIVNLLMEQQVDIGFVQANAVPAHNTPDSRISFTIPCVMAFHRSHRFNKKDRIDLIDLEGEPIIELSNQSSINLQIDNQCKKAGVKFIKKLQVSWFDLACKLVARNHGIAIVDLLSAHTFQHKDFEFRELNFSISYKIQMMYPPVSKPNTLINEFIGVLINQMPEQVIVNHHGD